MIGNKEKTWSKDEEGKLGDIGKIVISEDPGRPVLTSKGK